LSGTAWTEVDLSTIPTDNAIIPEGKYTFELLPGARYSKWDAGRIEFAGKVSGGEFPNKVIYSSYPDPEKVGNWVHGVFVRMQNAAGEGYEIEPNEDPVAYLNRVAGIHFVAKVLHRTYDKDGESVTKEDLKIGSISPVK
jgi:hypothetical protein